MTYDATDCECIIEEFVIESSEHLEIAVDDLLALESGPDQEAVNRIFRVVHTLKGTASMLGFTALSRFIHTVEDTCADIRSGQRTPDKRTIHGLLACIDFIQLKLDVIRDTHNEDDDFSLGHAHLKQLQTEPTSAVTPLAVVNKPAARPVPEGMDALLAFVGNGERRKTLIVEHDFQFRKTLYAALSKHTDCHIAKDGCEAIQAVTHSYTGPYPEPFSLIIMAADLPLIDGFQTTRAVRAMEQAKGAGYTHDKARIVMAMERNEWQAWHQSGLDCGADECMIKTTADFSTQQQNRRPSLHDRFAPTESLEMKCA